MSFPSVDELKNIAVHRMGQDALTIDFFGPAGLQVASGQLRRLAGTYIFALKNGIMGFATAPVQQDDVLAILRPHQNYLILREVKQPNDTLSHNEKKHRIVARLVITENKEKMKARIESSLKSCVFQIV